MHSSTYVITIHCIKYISTLLVINDETSTIPPLNFPPCLVLVKVVDTTRCKKIIKNYLGYLILATKLKKIKTI